MKFEILLFEVVQSRNDSERGDDEQSRPPMGEEALEERVGGGFVASEESADLVLPAAAAVGLGFLLQIGRNRVLNSYILEKYLYTIMFKLYLFLKGGQGAEHSFGILLHNLNILLIDVIDFVVLIAATVTVRVSETTLMHSDTHLTRLRRTR